MDLSDEMASGPLQEQKHSEHVPRSHMGSAASDDSLVSQIPLPYYIQHSPSIASGPAFRQSPYMPHGFQQQQFPLPSQQALQGSGSFQAQQSRSLYPSFHPQDMVSFQHHRPSEIDSFSRNQSHDLLDGRRPVSHETDVPQLLYAHGPGGSFQHRHQGHRQQPVNVGTYQHSYQDGSSLTAIAQTMQQTVLYNEIENTSYNNRSGRRMGQDRQKSDHYRTSDSYGHRLLPEDGDNLYAAGGAGMGIRLGDPQQDLEQMSTVSNFDRRVLRGNLPFHARNQPPSHWSTDLKPGPTTHTPDVESSSYSSKERNSGAHQRERSGSITSSINQRGRLPDSTSKLREVSVGSSHDHGNRSTKSSISNDLHDDNRFLPVVSHSNPSRMLVDLANTVHDPKFAKEAYRCPANDRAKAASSCTYKIDPLVNSPPVFKPRGRTERLSDAIEHFPTSGDGSRKRSPLRRAGPSILRSPAGTITTRTDSPAIQHPQYVSTSLPSRTHVSTPDHTIDDQPSGTPHSVVGSMQNRATSIVPLLASYDNPGSHGYGPSPHLQILVPYPGIKPTIDIAFDASNIPFETSARQAALPSSTGIVKISNIPYNVTKAEIVAFLGRSAKLLDDVLEPIHIIMERVTSKTMDAYAEFINVHEAMISVNRYEANRAGGRGGRLGERHVDLEVVGHEQLMKDLFPKAKNVTWEKAMPSIAPTNPNDRYSSGFQGFVTREELVMLIKHVEAPQRSPFSKECPQRPWECLIDTLAKYPWFMVDHITIEDRDMLYDATERLTSILWYRVNNNDINALVDARLLRRTQRAVFKCAGFTPAQKDNIAFICNMTPLQAGLTSHADQWTTLKTIGPRANVANDVLEFYLALLREATMSSAIVSLADQSAAISASKPQSLFGNVEIKYPASFEKMSIANIAKIEWDEIERLLRKVLRN